MDNAKDVVALVKKELAVFLKSEGLQASERLRGVLGAASALLRAFEQVDLIERLETLEAAAQGRGRAA